MKKILKSNMQIVVGFVIGTIISGSVVCASTVVFNASQITFDKANSNIDAINVQDALNKLYNNTTSENFLFDKYKDLVGTPTNYLNDGNNPPTTETPTTPPSNKSVYLALYSDGEYGVCVKRNGVQHCFVHGNFIVESKHLLEVFQDANCIYSTSSGYDCFARDHWCSVRPTGVVVCDDGLAKTCGVGLYSPYCS